MPKCLLGRQQVVGVSLKKEEQSQQIVGFVPRNAQSADVSSMELNLNNVDLQEGNHFFSLKGPAEIVKGLLNCRYQMVNFVLREIVDLSPGTHSACFLKRITCFFFRQPHISELVQRDLEVNNRRVLGYFASSSLPEWMGQALAD